MKTIQYLDNLISFKADEIADYVTNTSNYTGITVTITTNCGTAIVQTALNADTFNTTKPFYVDTPTNSILIAPLFFSLLQIVDGIYKIKIRLTKPQGYIEFENCAFVDVTIKCQVAAFIEQLLSESADIDNIEQNSTIIHLLHYALTNGSNCGCNCDKLCTVYNALIEVLTNNSKTIEDCGC